ncbi:unnamed protein product [Lampetra planeri]
MPTPTFRASVRSAGNEGQFTCDGVCAWLSTACVAQHGVRGSARRAWLRTACVAQHGDDSWFAAIFWASGTGIPRANERR